MSSIFLDRPADVLVAGVLSKIPSSLETRKVAGWLAGGFLLLFVGIGAARRRELFWW